jgi:hypothetical protein
MIDESFTYTRHNADGTKETVVGNNKDVYIFLKDKLELSEHLIYKNMHSLSKTMYLMVVLSVASSLITGLAMRYL